MKIEILEGQSDRLYSLLAPMVMDRNVLRQNHNYPFWTSPSHVWFVAMNQKNEIISFFPLEINGKKEAKINNYYMKMVRKNIFQAMIDEIVDYCYKKYSLSAVALIQHKELFESVGFQSIKEWKLYAKMEYEPKKRAAKTGKKEKE